VDVFELSDRLVDDIARISPIAATALGIPGYDHLWQDFSPAGIAAAREKLEEYRGAARDLPGPTSPWETLALRILIDYLEQSLEDIRWGEPLRDINNTASPLQMIVQIFDLMDKSSSEGCSNVITRLSTLSDVLGSWREALAEGMDRGLLAARRQVLSTIDECRSYAGEKSFLNALSQQLVECSDDERDVALAAARVAFIEFAEFLEDSYLPVAPDSDAVGERRYLRAARRFLGSDIDPLETYEWGWSEVRSMWDRMQEVADEIAPGLSVGEVLDLLKNDAARCVPNEEAFLEFIHNRQVDAVERLAGIHFDIPEAMQSVEVKLAPAGSALGAYYMQPSEDFSRPGTVFYSLGEGRPISVYDEVSTAYHEGFPGHHLQVGIQVGLAEKLSRLHRMVVWYPGYGEGWALYVEELMDELGFYDIPDYVMGLLINQMHRACRVVIDIGCHLELAIPAGSGFHSGEAWSYDLAVELLEQRAFLKPAYARSEVTRYFGWPGQAIAYKVGERAILDLRREFQQRDNDSFDLKAFHAQVLGYGSLGLDHLREMML
jgi:uncharacterized protein (DUF885 family)